MKIKVNRRELSDLVMACTICQFLGEMQSDRYGKLHDKLKAELDRYDEIIKFLGIEEVE